MSLADAVWTLALLLGAALAFGIWQGSWAAGLFMMCLLMFTTGLVAMARTR